MAVTVMSGVTETLFYSLVRVVSHNVSVQTLSKRVSFKQYLIQLY